MVMLAEPEIEVPQTTNRARVILWVRRWLKRHRKPRVYLVVRKEDVSEVSGIGVIAQVVEWPDGGAVMHWPENKTEDKPETTTVFPGPDGVKSIKKLHGHGGKTVLVKIS